MKVYRNGAPAGEAYGLDLREGDGIVLTVADEPQSGVTSVTVATGGSLPAPGYTYSWPGQQGNNNLGIGTKFPNGDGSGGGSNFTSNVALGGGRTDNTQPLDGNLGSITTGYDNVAIGTPALPMISTGHGNVAIGPDTLSFSTGSVSSCVAVGAQALEHNQSNSMVAIGGGALQASTTATGSVAVGASALNKQTTTASGNTAVGYQALATVVTSGSNTAVGYNALTLSTAANNTAVGTSALAACTTGNSNTAVGRTALGNTTTGSQNTAVGLNALQSANGSSNVALGQSAGAIAAVTDGSTFVGTNAGSSGGGSTDNHRMTLIGSATIGTGQGAVAIGIDSAGTGASAGTNQIALGTANHHTLWKTAAAPADASFAASQFSLWLDGTAGAAKLMIKAKNASGTVVTGSVTLS